MSKNRLNKGGFALFSGVDFEQMEFWHQDCAKDGIFGYPPYQHIHYMILGPLHLASNLLDNPTRL